MSDMFPKSVKMRREIKCRELRAGRWQVGTEVPTLPVTSSVVLAKPLYISEPQFPYL